MFFTFILIELIVTKKSLMVNRDYKNVSIISIKITDKKLLVIRI